MFLLYIDKVEVRTQLIYARPRKMMGKKEKEKLADVQVNVHIYAEGHVVRLIWGFSSVLNTSSNNIRV